MAAQALLAAIAERGADAAGYAFRNPDQQAIHVHKQRSGASALLEQVLVPETATQVLVHVRDYTKGHPTIEANNHPIRHGTVVGVHNGTVTNDEELFASYGFKRAADGMTVDSEAIFALAEHTGGSTAGLEELRGTLATAWLDERTPDVMAVARGCGRPLWIGRTRHEVFFASTREALEVVERYLRMTFTKRELEEGTLTRVRHGRVEAVERFTPDRSHVEDNPLPPVRAPHEGATCLQRLAAIAASVA